MLNIAKLHEATRLGETHLKSDGERRVITSGELSILTVYQTFGHDNRAAKAEYFAALHNAFVSGQLRDVSRMNNTIIGEPS